MTKIIYTLFCFSLLLIGCNKKSKNPTIAETPISSKTDLSKEEVKIKLGEKYLISVASISTNQGHEFDPIALDTTITGKYKIDDILNKKTLQRKIDNKMTFNSQLVEHNQFQSLPSYTSHFINYEIKCNAPLVRISVDATDQCTISLITNDKVNDHMVKIPLYKRLSTKGYSAHVSSSIKDCEIKRLIEETFGTSSSYVIDGVNLLPKRQTEQTFELQSEGQLILIEEKITNINMEFYESK